MAEEVRISVADRLFKGCRRNTQAGVSIVARSLADRSGFRARAKRRAALAAHALTE